MIIKRTVYHHLETWKARAGRKVLLLRGARQVGKTFIVRNFGKTFKHFIELNLLEQPRLKAIFTAENLDPKAILDGIAAYTSTPIVDGETLLFIDEIQASPAAISALRFFYEKRPNLHVIATGSLLEFALEDLPSYGVGRIEHLYMYPATFQEFLIASGEGLLLDQIKEASPTKPLLEPLHHKSLTLLKRYLTIGGMPEVLNRVLESGSLAEAASIHSQILVGYEDDFVKYRDKVETEELRETFRSAALQVGKKFIYSHAYRDANSKTVHKALTLLVKAGIVHKVFHSSGNGAPLGSEIDLTKFKTLPIDIGIFNRLIGLTLSDLALVDPLDLINKGTLVEAYCGLELLWSHDPQFADTLFYWHREARSSNAEVDYLVQLGTKIFPVEVKSSSKGAMRSLRRFLSEKHRPLGVRLSTENFGRYANIITVPVYAVGELRRVLEGVELEK